MLRRMDDAPRRLRALPTWQLSRAALAGARHVAAALGEAGVRRHHYSVLVALDERGPASQAELGRRLGIDRSDMAAVVARLEDDGAIARTRDERDRRRNVVRLTAQGAATLADLQARVQTAQEALLAPLDEAERRELTRLLERLVAADAG
jgi:DNA-binding MarR family transcriptional regulator